MANAQYEIYLTNVFSLAQSMVIKSEAVADAINAYMATQYTASGGDSRYLVNEAYPTSWKYYMNLAGQYHPVDTLMQVTSQDTLQTIDFTVANLQVNTATAAAYAVGSRYFNDLVARYPFQEMLIRGIVNPVPIATALAAADGTVLWYDGTLVESNEMNLIGEITEWVQDYLMRWYNPAYAAIDDLYVAACLGTMYASLVNTILRIRLKYCHTYQTHSFHIRQFLASHGKLDEFVDSMTKSQLLWAYRNIRYIQRNPGTQATFKTLIQNVMTARSLPLSDWTMRHDLTNTQANYTPNPEFVRGSLNTLGAVDVGNVRTVTEMLTAEAPLAKDNLADAGTVSDVTTTLTLSASDQLSTKVLESSVLDLTDAAPYTLSDALINHWLYFAAIGRYTAVVQVPNPKTGDMYALSAADAFVVYMYAYTVSQGLPLTTIPTLTANKVRKLVTPPISELQPYMDSRVIDASDLAAVYLNLPVLAKEYISIASFNTAIRAIHTSELYQHALFSTQGHLWKRAQLEMATLYLYCDYACNLGAGTAYTTWFAARGLDVPTLTTDELSLLASSILTTATGANLTATESLGNLQAAMLKLMARLSSYSVQYLSQINSSPIKVLERPSIRLGDIGTVADDQSYVVIPYADIIGEHGQARNEFSGVTIQDVSIYDWEARAASLVEGGLQVFPIGGIAVTTMERIPLIMADLRTVSDNLTYTLAPSTVTEVPAYQPVGLSPISGAFGNLTLGFYGLSSTDILTLQSRYDAYIVANGTPTASLARSFIQNILPGMTGPQVNILDSFTQAILPGLLGPQQTMQQGFPVTNLDGLIGVQEVLSVGFPSTTLNGLYGPYNALNAAFTTTILAGLTAP